MKTSTTILIATSVLVFGGLGAYLLLGRKKLPAMPVAPPPPPTTPDPVTPEPVAPAVPKMSAKEKYQKKLDGAAGMLYEALNGLDWNGAGEDQFWEVTRALEQDEREDVADVYDDEWGDLCNDIEGDFSWGDEDRALKNYGFSYGKTNWGVRVSNC